MEKENNFMIVAKMKDIKERIDPDTENLDNARIMVAYTYDRDQALELKK